MFCSHNHKFFSLRVLVAVMWKPCCWWRLLLGTACQQQRQDDCSGLGCLWHNWMSVCIWDCFLWVVPTLTHYSAVSDIPFDSRYMYIYIYIYVCIYEYVFVFVYIYMYIVLPKRIFFQNVTSQKWTVERGPRILKMNNKVWTHILGRFFRIRTMQTQEIPECKPNKQILKIEKPKFPNLIPQPTHAESESSLGIFKNLVKN